MIHPIKISDTLSVSGQPQPADMEAIAAQGFKVVVCNRPDGEADDQPAMAAMAAAVEAAGMRFVEYPVNPMNFPGDDVEGLGALFNGDTPVFAFCRTGTRCANLWLLTQPESERAGAVEHAQSLGFDLSLARRHLG